MHGEPGSASLNGSLGADLPPVGSRGDAPGRGSGAKPPEADGNLRFATQIPYRFFKLILNSAP